MIQSITGLAQVSQRLGRDVLIHQALTASADEISPLRDTTHFNWISLLRTNVIGRNDGARHVSAGVIAVCDA